MDQSKNVDFFWLSNHLPPQTTWRGDFANNEYESVNGEFKFNYFCSLIVEVVKFTGSLGLYLQEFNNPNYTDELNNEINSFRIYHREFFEEIEKRFEEQYFIRPLETSTTVIYILRNYDKLISQITGWIGKNELHRDSLTELQKSLKFILYKLSFFSVEFNSVNLVKDLEQIEFESHEEYNSLSQNRNAKGLWGLKTRYDFLKELGIIDHITIGTSDQLLQRDRNLILQQIMCCSIENAKKLMNNGYNAESKPDHQIEKDQLLNKWKHNKNK
jgi:hypothetical protein